LLWRLIEFADLPAFSGREGGSPTTNSFCGAGLPVRIEAELLGSWVIGSDWDRGILSETEGLVGVDDSGLINKEWDPFDIDMLIFCHLSVRIYPDMQIADLKFLTQTNKIE
jgi:hypothetical protein